MLRYEPITITRQCDTYECECGDWFCLDQRQDNLTLVDADAPLLHVPHGPIPTSLHMVGCGEVVVDGNSSLQVLGCHSVIIPTNHLIFKCRRRASTSVLITLSRRSACSLFSDIQDYS